MKTSTSLRLVSIDEENLDHQVTSAIPRLHLVPDLAPVLEPDPVVVPEPTAPPAEAPVAEVVPGSSIVGRIVALSFLLATLAGLGWLGVQIFHVVDDSWIAPLHLSPDNDSIVQLRVQHERNLAELSRLDAEVSRLDSAIAAVDTAIARLATLRGSSTDTMQWRADESRVEANGLATSAELMQRQRALLEQLHERQSRIVERARADLAAGVIDRTAVDRDEQARDQLALQIADLDRQIAEAATRRRQARTQLRALRASVDDTADSSDGTMPEVAAGDEHSARIEIEIERLSAEARGHRAQRDAAVASIRSQRALLSELEDRPLYRAMRADTDVAFVPYDQLDGVAPGAAIMACTWGIFACEEVGRVSALMRGEVVTQDPWGEMARGQYAVILLTDRDAIRERVLRVRRSD